MYWQGVLGLLMFSLIAWLMSEQRAAGGLAGRLRLILSGLLIQLVLAFALLKLPLFQWAFVKLNAVVVILQTATEAGTGTSFVFGYIGGPVTIAPDRRAEIETLGLKCIVDGTLSTCMTGAVAGLILS